MASIFLGAYLAIDIMQELQTNLEEKVKPIILKEDFSFRTELSTPVEFFKHWNQQYISCPSPQCLVDQIQVQ